MTKEEKLAKLKSTITNIKKEHGRDAVYEYDQEKHNMRFIPLSSLALREVIHPQGLVRGRVYEFWGENSNGKSLICNLIAKDVQDNGGIVGILDYEFSNDIDFNKNTIGLKVDPDNYLVFTPSTSEDGFSIIEQIAESGAVDLLIVDSTNAMPSQREVNGDYGDALMGANALAISTGLRRISSKLAKSGMSVLFISQIRRKFVIIGDNRVFGCGESMKFFASCRIEVRKEKGDEEKTGEGISKIDINLINKKNKLSTPYKKSILTFDFKEKSIDYYKEIIPFAIKYNIIDKAGSWYSYGEQKIGQGKENVSNFLKENQNIYEEVKARVIKEIFPSIEEEPEEKEKPKRKTNK